MLMRCRCNPPRPNWSGLRPLWCRPCQTCGAPIFAADGRVRYQWGEPVGVPNEVDDDREPVTRAELLAREANAVYLLGWIQLQFDERGQNDRWNADWAAELRWRRKELERYMAELQLRLKATSAVAVHVEEHAEGA